MNVLTIIELLNSAISSDEISDSEKEECVKLRDDIEILAYDFIESSSVSEDDIIEKCIEAVEFVRLLNLIDNAKMEKLIELPLIVKNPEEGSDSDDDEDDNEESEESEEEDTDAKNANDRPAFDLRSLDY